MLFWIPDWDRPLFWPPDKVLPLFWTPEIELPMFWPPDGMLPLFWRAGKMLPLLLLLIPEKGMLLSGIPDGTSLVWKPDGMPLFWTPDGIFPLLLTAEGILFWGPDKDKPLLRRFGGFLVFCGFNLHSLVNIEIEQTENKNNVKTSIVYFHLKTTNNFLNKVVTFYHLPLFKYYYKFGSPI